MLVRFSTQSLTASVKRFVLLSAGVLSSACVDAKSELPLAPIAPVAAQGGIPTVVVNTLLDDVANPNDQDIPACTDAKCTFRQALATVADGGTITFHDDLCAGAPSCEIHAADLLLRRPVPVGFYDFDFEVVINGPTAYSLTIRQTSDDQRPTLMWVWGQITIRNLAFEGSGVCCASGLIATGTLTLENVSVHGIVGLFGGIVMGFDGELVLRNSRVIGNESMNNGGGINLYQGSRATLINTVVSGNRAPDGGGVYLRMADLTLLKKSCISGNTPNDLGWSAGAGPIGVPGVIQGINCP